MLQNWYDWMSFGSYCFFWKLMVGLLQSQVSIYIHQNLINDIFVKKTENEINLPLSTICGYKMPHCKMLDKKGASQFFYACDLPAYASCIFHFNCLRWTKSETVLDINLLVVYSLIFMSHHLSHFKNSRSRKAVIAIFNE